MTFLAVSGQAGVSPSNFNCQSSLSCADADADMILLIQIPYLCPNVKLPVDNPAPFVAGEENDSPNGAVSSFATVSIVAFTPSTANAMAIIEDADGVCVSIHTTLEDNVKDP